MKKTFLFVLMALTLVPFYSCKKDSKGDSTMLPNISGAPNDVLIVLRKELWTDSIGVTYKDIFEDQFPYLPQVEPLFDVVFLSPDAFTPMFRSHRNIIQNNITDKVTEPTITLKRDFWAAPQTIVIVSSPSFKEAIPFLKENSEMLINIFEQAERDRYIQIANEISETGVVNELLKKNISMSIPKGYKMNANTANFTWFSHETPQSSQGIIVFKFPYTDNNTLTAEYLTKKRNEFVKQIPGPTDGSYMITSEVIPPMFSQMMYKNAYRGVMRGFWDVYKHPMGGPFIAHILVDEVRQEVVYVEAYVYSPNKEKREPLRQTESLLYSVSIVPEKAAK